MSMFPHSHRKKVQLTLALSCIWLLSLGFGLRSLLSYETTPGTAAHPPERWPSDAQIAPSTTDFTLVMLAHPFCPCTSASMNELAQVMAQTNGKMRAYVLFLKPANAGSDWDDSALRRTAAAIPGVVVVTDEDGVEAKRFGATTSGHTLLFDRAGRRIFSGGITGSRGHAGGNAGEDSVVTLVNGGAKSRSSTLVFGCALRNEKDCDQTSHR